MHHRLEPKQHRFHYNVFMFYVDLDELEEISKKILLVSINRFNIFSFRNKDHLQLPKDAPDKQKNTKEHVLQWLKEQQVVLNEPKLMLLTNFCTFGYQFNPVSFYFVYEKGQLHCVVAEISNTYREMKPYLLGKECFRDGEFKMRTTKYFYVSPFIDHDADFDFAVKEPGEKLNIRIDDHKDGSRIFLSTLTGDKKRLTNARLWWYAMRFPLITLQVIGLIHWNAFRLWLKKIRYFKKEDHKDLQRGVYKAGK